MSQIFVIFFLLFGFWPKPKSQQNICETSEQKFLTILLKGCDCVVVVVVAVVVVVC